jgi:KUP system potassium uptake protein
VVPIAAVILTVLFAVQRFGTGGWAAVRAGHAAVVRRSLAVAGLARSSAAPGVLKGLSPTYASFRRRPPRHRVRRDGRVVLVITGAEALYADMGHFGRPPIRAPGSSSSSRR